jgi:sporulation protein YlmC with PRC-barrel domain
MAGEEQFTIGTRANCSDGACGEVRRLVIDPGTDTVTHLVIGPEHGHETGRLVPVDLVDTTAGELSLRCSLAEFNGLDPAEERHLVAGMEGVTGGTIGGAPADWAGPAHRYTAVDDVVPEGETQVLPGQPVHAVDGEIGRVQGFVVDQDDHRVTHVLLQEGHLWGRKQVAIPVSAVTMIDDWVRLNITKDEVANLPPVG